MTNLVIQQGSNSLKFENKENGKLHALNVPIARVGKFTASGGEDLVLTPEKLQSIADSTNAYLASGKECPLQVTHMDNTMALVFDFCLGYASNVHTDGNRLMADFEILSDKEEIVSSGRYRALSMALDVESNRLVHVAAVGDQAIDVANLKGAEFLRFEEKQNAIKQFFTNLFNPKEDTMSEPNKEVVEMQNIPVSPTPNAQVSLEEFNAVKAEFERFKKETAEKEVKTELALALKEGKLNKKQLEKSEELMLSMNEKQLSLFREIISDNTIVDFSDQNNLKSFDFGSDLNKKDEVSAEEDAAIEKAVNAIKGGK